MIARIGEAALALGLALVLLTGCAAAQGSGSPASGPPGAASSGTTSSGTASSGTASSGTASSVMPAEAFDRVLALVLERLATGDSVAASKFFSGQPVTDAVREKAVLDAAAARAAQVGVDPVYVSAVFSDQIAASKEVQQSLLEAWAGGTAAPPTAAPHLTTEVRPILDRITQDLVPALGAIDGLRHDPGCAPALAAATSRATPAPTALAALPTATAHLCG